MRLICPNCGAQYEVSDDVIPEAGRDVQCSNCGHTWFQNLSQPDPELSQEDDITLIEPEEWEDLPAPDTQVGDIAQTDILEDDEDYSGQDTTYGGPSNDDWLDDHDDPIADIPAYHGDIPEPASNPDIPTPVAPTVPSHREMDPEVASILRQEAELEAKARAADGSGLETQGDLGLIEADPAITKREAEIRERMADIQGLPNTDPDGPRRELLPDIEEINSSLSARTPEPGDSNFDQYEYEIQNRRGFRFGFFLVASLVIFTVLLYAYGPQVVETIPQAGGMISDFTAYVDKSRIWLDSAVQNFIAKVSAI